MLLRYLISFLSAALLSTSSYAELTTYRVNGFTQAGIPTFEVVTNPDFNRVNVVFVAEGYDESEINNFEYILHVTGAIDYLFQFQPYRKHHDLFNFHVIDDASNESLFGHLRAGTEKDTLYDTSICFTNNFCVDTSAVAATVESELGANTELVSSVVILINELTQIENIAEDGSVYLTDFLAANATAGTTPSGRKLSMVLSAGHPDPANGIIAKALPHEFGHSIGELADEYAQRPDFCGGRPTQPNVSFDSENVPWASWLVLDENGDPLRTEQSVETHCASVDLTPFCQQLDPVNPASQCDPSIEDEARELCENTTVGIFEGGMYCVNGVYRPTLGSIMRSGDYFDKVGTEQLVKKMHNKVAILENPSPTEKLLTVNPSTTSTVNFSVDMVANRPSSTSVAFSSPIWKLNNVLQSISNSFSIDVSQLPLGVHEVEATSIFTSSDVYSFLDPDMSDSETWTLIVDDGSAITAAPTGVSFNDCLLSWNPVTRAQSYEVVINGSHTTPIDATSASCAELSLLSNPISYNQTNTFQVRAIGVQNTGPLSTAVSASPDNRCVTPKAVSDVAALNTGRYESTLRWTNVPQRSVSFNGIGINTDIIESLEVSMENLSTGGVAAPVTIDFNSLSRLTLDDLTENQDYRVSIRQQNSCGEFGPSQQVEFTTQCYGHYPSEALDIKVNDEPEKIPNRGFHVSWPYPFGVGDFYGFTVELNKLGTGWVETKQVTSLETTFEDLDDGIYYIVAHITNSCYDRDAADNSNGGMIY